MILNPLRKPGFVKGYQNKIYNHPKIMRLDD